MPADVAASSDDVPAALDLRGVQVRRRNGFEVSLPELVIRDRGVAALVGPSGCGKTTLLWGVLDLLPDVTVSGDRKLLGTAWPASDTSAWRELLAGPVTIVMQDAKAALDPLQRIGVQVQTITGQAADQVLAALSRLGLTDASRIAGSWPHQISGGQAQKVLLAIALLRAPRLLLMDEPTASLDGASIDELVENLRILREQHGTAMLIATHDLSLVEALEAEVFDHRDGRFTRAAARAETPPRPERSAVGEVVLQVRGIEKSFGDRSVLRGVEFDLRAGEVLAVVGPSGCGKTTLARILVGELVADAGRVQGAEGMQILSQDAYASLTPGRRIAALLRETATVGFDAEAEAIALGLTAEHLEKTADQLSGGERRRAALLRALSVAPRLLILDEPTASLDRSAALAVMTQLMEVQRRRELACLWITHDRQLADCFAHRILQMRQGRFE